jgi:formylglycine-generating enzyme
VVFDLLKQRRRSARGFLAAVLAAFVALPGCQLVGGYESFQHHPCDVLQAQEKSDDEDLTTLVLSKREDGSCYWIGRTEVTVEQYQEFVDDAGDDWSWGEDCAWKSPDDGVGGVSDPVAEDDPCSMAAASAESDAFRASKPIRCVDWCDAQAFCQWAGMELCGGLSTGGVVRPTDVPDEWGQACAAANESYPYGAKSVSLACNIGLDSNDCFEVLNQSNCAPTDVDTFDQCESPPGNMDMLGNVAEWALQCGNSDPPDLPKEKCQTRGGSFEDDLTDHCKTVKNVQRDAREAALGVRCCDKLSSSEERELREATPP